MSRGTNILCVGGQTYYGGGQKRFVWGDKHTVDGGQTSCVYGDKHPVCKGTNILVKGDKQNVFYPFFCKD
jgi:hypothetical protein